MSNRSKPNQLTKKVRQESRELAAAAKSVAANVMDLASEAKDALASAAQTVTEKVEDSRAELKNAVNNLKH